MVKFAINQATMALVPTEQFLTAASEAGFEGVEYRFDKLIEYFKGGHTTADLIKTVSDLGLEQISINSIEDFSLCEEEVYSREFSNWKGMMEIGRKIGCDLVITVPSFQDCCAEASSMDYEAIVKETARGSGGFGHTGVQ